MNSGKSNTVLCGAIDSLSTAHVEASAQLERRQLEMLLIHALKVSGGDFSYIASAAGEGAYAEQFVQLDAAAIRTASGDLEACHESLNSRRADPGTRGVMRDKKIVLGSVLTHGLPLHFPKTSITVTNFVQIPLVSAVRKISVLFVANPCISASGKLQGDILNRLLELADVVSKRRQRKQRSKKKRARTPSFVESTFKLKRLKEAVDHPIVTVNTTGVIRAINPSAEQLLGCTSDNALGMTLDRYLAPKYFVSTLQQVDSWNPKRGEERILAMNHRTVSILAEDGMTKEFNAAAYYLRDNKEKLVSFVLGNPKSNQATTAVCSDTNSLVNSLSLGVIRLDNDCQCEYANDLWSQISGQSAAEARGLGWTEMVHTEDLMSLWLELGSDLEKRQLYSGKIRLQRSDGGVRQLLLSASCVPDEAGRANGFVMVFQDLTADFLAQQKVNYVVEHDALTGMVNRSAFLDRLQRRLNYPHLRSKTALLYIDVNGLKAINASVGQYAGDETLRQLSKRLLSCVGNNVLSARLGGSEFSLLIMQTIDPFEICSIAERIVKCVREPFIVFGDSLRLCAAVGISLGDDNANSSDELLRQSNVALSAATRSKCGNWKVYDRKLNCECVEQTRLNERIRLAVANKEFTLEYQPQYSLERDDIISFEALLRWQPPDIPAPETKQLVYLLESLGLMLEVGCWMVKSACRQFMMWKEIGLLAEGCTMSVKLASNHLLNAEFPGQIASILSQHHMRPDQLNLEIATSVLDDNNTAAYQLVDELKNIGVRLSLSTFGAGSASLAHLNRLPVDFLKIDQSLVKSIGTHESGHRMVMSVLAMANTLDIDIVADGIESADTLGKLKDAQCKFVQGDLISKARSPAILEPMLVRRNYKSEDMLQLS